jgi:hypothetical protein
MKEKRPYRHFAHTQAQLDDMGINSYIERRSKKLFELYINFEIIKQAKTRETLKRYCQKKYLTNL